MVLRASRQRRSFQRSFSLCSPFNEPPQSYEDYLEVVLARVDCLRRGGAAAAPALRAALQRGAELLQGYFPDAVDRTYRWARAGRLMVWWTAAAVLLH